MDKLVIIEGSAAIWLRSGRSSNLYTARLLEAGAAFPKTEDRWPSSPQPEANVFAKENGHVGVHTCVLQLPTETKLSYFHAGLVPGLSPSLEKFSLENVTRPLPILLLPLLRIAN